MIMVKDKLFMERNIFGETSTGYASLCFGQKWGVALKCMLVCVVEVCVQMGTFGSRSRSKLQ